MDAAKADADGPKRFAPYLRLYIAGNPLDGNGQDEADRGTESRGCPDRGLIRPVSSLMNMGFGRDGADDLVESSHGRALRSVSPSRSTPRVILAVALTIAFGFEVVNGFHDTANAVTTVIYTRTLRPMPAVFFSRLLQFPGCACWGERRSPSASSTCCRWTC